MENEVVDTLMGILAVYCDFVRKGLLRTKGIMPPKQQKAIDEFARMHGCEISWREDYKVHLWSRLESE